MTGLLIAAFEPELSGLEAAPPAGWLVATTGAGAAVAGAVTARLLAEHRPARVLFAGTCGAYDGRLAVGDLLLAASAIATSQDELEGRAYRPQIERTRFDATWTPPLALPAHPVAVPQAITMTFEGARRLAAVAPVEHLELTGVFGACHLASVPVAAILGVANRVGPDAHAEWLANNARVSASVIAAARALLR